MVPTATSGLILTGPLSRRDHKENRLAAHPQRSPADPALAAADFTLGPSSGFPSPRWRTLFDAASPPDGAPA
jgi:hypothetical protein